MMSKLFKILKVIFFSPVICFILVFYCFSGKKKLINQDIKVYSSNLSKNKYLNLIYLVLFQRETFRNVLYYRLGRSAEIINFFLKRNPTLHIMTNDIGGGLLIVHGDATYIRARKIGENCYINQCVTIGVNGKDAPIIGDNVRIATGAIVLGNVSVGNNSIVGAGAVVVKNVPDNATVVGNPARIIKLKGQKVNISL